MANLDIVVDAALGALALSLLLLVATAIVRVAASARAARDNRLTDLWTPVFLGISVDKWPGPPHRRDERAVLALWNRLRSAMRGEATRPLVARARATALHDIALRLLDSRRADDRLNAVAAVGTLGLPSSLPALERFARRSGASITLRSEAARSMLRLHAVRTLPVVLELLRTQPDWHPALIASVLDEADPDAVALGLVNEAASAEWRGEFDVAARFLRVLTAVASDACLPGVRNLLDNSDTPDIQAACIHVLGHFADRRDARNIRRYLHSPIWFVRVHAASALGAVGTADDEPALVALLDDREWWVRQRAAEALARLAALEPDELAVVFEHHPEVGRFAGAPYSSLAEVQS